MGLALIETSAITNGSVEDSQLKSSLSPADIFTIKKLQVQETNNEML